MTCLPPTILPSPSGAPMKNLTRLTLIVLGLLVVTNVALVFFG